MNYLAIFIGGGLGSLFRYLIGLVFINLKWKNFPIGTLIANILACLVMALFITWSSEKTDIDDHYKKLVLVGICGGLSTFSTFSLESIKLFKEGQILIAVLNVTISIILCFSILYHFSQKWS